MLVILIVIMMKKKVMTTTIMAVIMVKRVMIRRITMDRIMMIIIVVYMTIAPNRLIVTIITETLDANPIILDTIPRLTIVVKKIRPERMKMLII